MSLVAKVFVVLNLIASVAFAIFAMNVWVAPTKWQKMYEHEKVLNVEWLAKTQKQQLDLERDVVFQKQEVAKHRIENLALTLQRNAERDKQYELQIKIAQIENEKQIKEADNQEMTREKQRYFDEILKQKAIITKQQSAVIVERDNAVKARTLASELENEINATKSSLAALMRDKRSIEEELALQTHRIEGLIRKGVAVDIILNLDPAATQAALPDSRVLQSDPATGLVMLSIGSQNGVKPGNQLMVSRGSEYLGRVQVLTVYPDMCSARVVPGMGKGEIQKGDEARSK